MNEEVAVLLRGYAADNQWSAIMPEIMLAVLALALLATEIVLPRSRQALVGQLALWGQVFVLGVVCIPFGLFEIAPNAIFSGLITQSDVTQLMRGFFLLSSILVTFLGQIYLSKQALPKTEFYHLVIVIAAGLMLLVQSSNFVMLFVALETVTVAFYVLVAYCRTSSLSLEGGLKYLILGALSSSILLFGIVLLYGVAGNPILPASSPDALNFSELREFLVANPDNRIAAIGALLVVGGLCFKIGAVPFQIWVPDVYQGAPTPVTAYLAVASKAGGFVVLMELLSGPFAALHPILVPVLAFIAGATILFGNIAAVGQRNVKRLMGLSGIAHAGYLLVGVIASLYISWAQYAVIFYLVTYLLASFAVFGVMALLAKADDASQELEDYDDLARREPFLGGVLAVGLGSLAGIPPLGGFIGKLFVFVAAFQAGLYGLLALSVLGVAISIYYYFGWIREVYFGQPKGIPASGASLAALRHRVVLIALTGATVLLGIFPAAFPIVP